MQPKNLKVMKIQKVLLIAVLALLCSFGEAVVTACYAATPEVTAVMKHKKKKKKKKKSSSSKVSKGTTRTVVGYVSQVHEKTPEEIKHEQDSIAKERAEFLRNDSVYTAVEVKPEFPGGEDAMYEFINQNLKYPDDAFEAGIQGSVDCYLVVRKDGTITDVKAVTGAWESLKTEAVRIVESMPNWTPGMQDGEYVSYRHRIRIMFLRTGNLSGY